MQSATTACASCGRISVAEFDHCPGCGRKKNRDVAPVRRGPGSTSCATCGRESASYLTRCPHCKKPKHGSEAQVPAAPAPAPVRFEPPPAAPMLGDLEQADPASIGAYRLLGRLGAGGMGVVYLAEDQQGSRYAIKALAGSHRMGTELRSRLEREARALTAIDTPHVVRVVAVDTSAEVPYIVMSHAEGVGLDKAVPAGGLPAASVAEYGAQLAGAVAYVHQRGILHRDLKPQNVILGPGGVTLVDFGIASLDDEGATALTRQGTFLGSLAWLAPEVIGGDAADEQSDAFGLGLVLGFMALGRNPFGTGRPETVMYRIMHGEPDFEGCDPQIASVIGPALAKDPSERASVAQIHAAILAQWDIYRPRQMEDARRALEDFKARAQEQAREELQRVRSGLEAQARQEWEMLHRRVDESLREAERSISARLTRELEELQQRLEVRG